MPQNEVIVQAIQAGYLVWRWSLGEELSNKYWTYCADNGIPFVRITTDGGHGRRFAEVEMDMLTTAFATVLHSAADDEEYFAEVENLFKRYGDSKPTKRDIEQHGYTTYSIGDWPACYRIPKDDAETVARGLLEIGKRWASKYEQLA